jgi:hypothetical protein
VTRAAMSARSTLVLFGGILSFEAVFMPFMLGSDGHPLVEKMKSQLPAPHDGNVVELKAQQP